MTFGFGSRGNPAICMTHHAAMEYTRWLSAKTGKLYRLPTEAEWEYAARAGTTTPYSCGEGTEDLGEYAWYVENAEKPMPVGKKKPNPWGLHDIHGNVSEWCIDLYKPDAYAEFAKLGEPGQGAGRPADACRILVRRPGRVVGRRRRQAPLGQPDQLEPRVVGAGPPAPAEHLVAHRRDPRGLPRGPAAGRAGKSQRGPLAGCEGERDPLSYEVSPNRPRIVVPLPPDRSVLTGRNRRPSP